VAIDAVQTDAETLHEDGFAEAVAKVLLGQTDE
jgi:hypothetical protein